MFLSVIAAMPFFFISSDSPHPSSSCCSLFCAARGASCSTTSVMTLASASTVVRATQPEELDGYFPELRELVKYCQFNDCAHYEEPGCAVIKAVEEGKVSAERYESYLRMRAGDE